MAQVINTNIMSLMAQQNLNKSQNALSNSIRHLSTGYRINSAKDDAAGQGIANRFTSQIRGLTQAIRNANDGISLIQTIESGVSQINDNLQRMRELTVQALNGTNSMDDIRSIYKELRNRILEIQRIGEQVIFNDKAVLLKDNTTSFQVGSYDLQVVKFYAKKMNAFEGIGSVYRPLLGFDDRAGIIDMQKDSWLKSFAEEFTFKYNDYQLGYSKIDEQVDGQYGNGLTTILRDLDQYIYEVDSYRGELGANQNRFEAIVTELNGRVNNLTTSRSQIEDADYATEISNMTRAQILQQASTAVLAQANQAPQTVLSLLQQLMQ